MIDIYGCSDDLIEIEGDIVAEWDAYDAGLTWLYFDAKTSFRVGIIYGNDGEWSFLGPFPRTARVFSVGSTEADKNCKYSETLRIDDDTITAIHRVTDTARRKVK